MRYSTLLAYGQALLTIAADLLCSNEPSEESATWLDRMRRTAAAPTPVAIDSPSLQEHSVLAQHALSDAGFTRVAEAHERRRAAAPTRRDEVGAFRARAQVARMTRLDGRPEEGRRLFEALLPPMDEALGASRQRRR